MFNQVKDGKWISAPELQIICLIEVALVCLFEQKEECRLGRTWKSCFDDGENMIDLELFSVSVIGLSCHEKVVKEAVKIFKCRSLLRIGVPTLAHDRVHRVWTFAIGGFWHSVSSLNLLNHFSIVHTCRINKSDYCKKSLIIIKISYAKLPGYGTWPWVINSYSNMP